MSISVNHELFSSRFGHPPLLAVRAPGRVNLIGEHIDYLGGTVLPMAINRDVRLLLGKNSGEVHRLATLQFPGEPVVEISMKHLNSHPAGSWTRYPLGVMREFELLGFALPGLDLLFDGDLPPGSGLSSSAAIEVATAFALNQLLGAGLKPLELARLAQRAENNFVGVPCGIMDQTAIACCRAGHALRLDCSAPNLTPEHIPIPPEVTFIIAHCGVQRSLDASPYELRVAECRQALDLINSNVPEPYGHLAKVPQKLPMKILGTLFGAIPQAELRRAGDSLRRATYAAAEQERVGYFRSDLSRWDFSRAGKGLNSSHSGLRDEYQVSCPELDDLTRLARQCHGVYGSRLTGAGFGGCALIMARSDAADRIIAKLKQTYYDAREIEPMIFESPPMDGAELIS